MSHNTIHKAYCIKQQFKHIIIGSKHVITTINTITTWATTLPASQALQIGFTCHHSPWELSRRSIQVSLSLTLLESFLDEVHRCHFPSVSLRASPTKYICATSHHSSRKPPAKLISGIVTQNYLLLYSPRHLGVESTVKVTLKLISRDWESAHLSLSHHHTSIHLHIITIILNNINSTISTHKIIHHIKHCSRNPLPSPLSSSQCSSFQWLSLP